MEEVCAADKIKLEREVDIARICSDHFQRDCYSNWMKVSMRNVAKLDLKDKFQVPTIYPEGTCSTLASTKTRAKNLTPAPGPVPSCQTPDGHGMNTKTKTLLWLFDKCPPIFSVPGNHGFTGPYPPTGEQVLLQYHGYHKQLQQASHLQSSALDAARLVTKDLQDWW
ncbi:hypothetical protein GWK47_043571 [Chionoecetes opilio]|uniref:THAP-type domain-containing protein n=1 Tax=Chionoecetes opilio TaxID=41210 RepID=A0A8J5CW31_CHIOP|nr:hypothetical protein GWK47_043571 [Chionoecetes opilio]